MCWLNGPKDAKIFNKLDVDFDWEEIFDTFKNIPLEDVSLKKGKLDEEKVKEILVDEHDFDIIRVEKTLNEIKGKEKDSLKKWF